MARTGENIYKRKDGRWEARYIASRDHGGKARYKSLYGETYGEVKEKRTQALVAAQAAQETQRCKAGLFETLTANWLEHIQGTAKDSTFAQYLSSIDRHIVPYWQGWQIGEITTVQMERYLSHLLKNGRLDGKGGLSPKTAADILILLKSVFKYAKDYPVVCDFEEIQMPKSENPMRVFTRREQRILTDFLLTDIDRSKLGVLLGLYTGPRIGELCALTEKHIGLMDQSLEIRRTMQRIKNLSGEGGTKTKIVITKPKTDKSIREIPIPKFLMPLLRKLVAAPDAHILTGSAEIFVEPRLMQKRFKAYLKAAGVEDAGFHALRHSLASRAVENGFDIKSLSELLGHANIQTTLRLYVHPSFETKRKYMDKLSPETI